MKYMTITTDRSYYWLINTAKKWRLKAKKSRILMEISSYCATFSLRAMTGRSAKGSSAPDVGNGNLFLCFVCTEFVSVLRIPQPNKNVCLKLFRTYMGAE